MSDKIKIAWQGPGWYLGRHDENENIIMEWVAAWAEGRPQAVEIAGSHEVVCYSEPPAYMEAIEVQPPPTPVTHPNLPGALWCPDCFLDRSAVVMLEWLQTVAHGEHYICSRRCGYHVVLDDDDLEALGVNR